MGVSTALFLHIKFDLINELRIIVSVAIISIATMGTNNRLFEGHIQNHITIAANRASFIAIRRKWRYITIANGDHHCLW